MTDILCRWLNDEVKLSSNIGAENVSKELSSGYLLGEVLAKHGLQVDFNLFSKIGSASAKLNNFTRIEPTLALLGIKFDTNVAKDIMDQKSGSATRLLYQLFVALQNVKKRNLSSIAMETMRPNAPANLDNIETRIYRERLKMLVPRQIDLDFDDLVHHFNEKQKHHEDKMHQLKLEENAKLKKYQQTKREENIERNRNVKRQRDIMNEKIKKAKVIIPTKSSKQTLMKSNGKDGKLTASEFVKNNIDEFERSLANSLPPVRPPSSEKRKSDDDHVNQVLTDAKLLLAMQDIKSEQYMKSVKEKAKEGLIARKEREKRRRRVLIEQFKAHEAEMESKREEMFVNRLMRQSQMERRIAVQLMHVRHEKAVIKENRIAHAEQVRQRREKDFEEALEKEAELCRQAKMDYAHEIETSRRLHAEIMAERQEAKYQKHYTMCCEIVNQIINFSCKVCDYRELTEKCLPPKLVREWKALFLKGIDLNPDNKEQVQIDTTEGDDDIMDDRQPEDITVLDEEDFTEFYTLAGEWKFETDQQTMESIQAPIENPILGHVLHRIQRIVCKEERPPTPPYFPPFPIRACVVGKFFCGKSTAIKKIVDSYRVQSLEIDQLVSDAIEAYQSSSNQNEQDLDQLNDLNDSMMSEPPCQENAKHGIIANNDEIENGNITPLNTEADDITQSTVSMDNKESIAKLVEKTTLADLGENASNCLANGEQINDELLVKILVHAIRNIPEGTGWIVDGFPCTLNQAKIFERELTGYQSPTKSAERNGGKKAKKANRLVNDPHPSPEVPIHISGIDLVIYFKLDDDVVLQRAEGRTRTPSGETVYHEEFFPPPQGAYTGMGHQSQIQPVVDWSNDKEQVLARLTGFHDAWSKLEKWWSKLNILKVVEAEKDKEIVASELITLLEEAEEKLRKIKEDKEMAEKEAELVLEREKQEAEAKATAEALDAEACVKEEIMAAEIAREPTTRENSSTKSIKGKKNQAPGPNKSDKKSPKKSPGKAGEKKADDAKRPKSARSTSDDKKGTKSPRATSPEKRSSRPTSRSSSKSSSRSGSRKNKNKAVEMNEEIEQEVAAYPIPGSLDWQYMDLILEEELAHILYEKWQATELSYINSVKYSLREIRARKQSLYKYFYSTRKEFVEYLRRPDTKQEFVAQWQEDYNSTPDDMRGDNETKAELHCRVEDLQERLWDICDSRKEQSENERSQIMNDGWLDDLIGLLINYCVTIMQADVERYQSACQLLRDYYVSMEFAAAPLNADKIRQGITGVLRLPLIEVIPTIPKENLLQRTSTVASIEPVKSSPSRRDRRSKTPDLCQTCEDGSEQKQTIPLVPRRPKSSDHTSSREKRGTPKREKSSEEKLFSPPPPSDQDERLIYDAFQMAMQAITMQVQLDEKDEEQYGLDNPDHQGVSTGHPKSAHKSQSKDKKSKKATGKGKSRSPSKIKLNDRTPTPAPDEEDLAAIEEQKRQTALREKCRIEYRAAIGNEGKIFNQRVSSCKSYAIKLIKYIKEKANICYSEMNDWLGERYQQEMKSIELLTMYMRIKIEMEEKIQPALILEDKDFVVDTDIKMFDTPPTLTSPPPTELMLPNVFTIEQIRIISKQFQSLCPSGLMSLHAFHATLETMVSHSLGMQIVPRSWECLTTKEVCNTAIFETCILYMSHPKLDVLCETRICTVPLQRTVHELLNCSPQEYSDKIAELTEYLAFEDLKVSWPLFVLSLAKPWPEPTHQDLLDTLDMIGDDKHHAEMISKQDFNCIKFWFEDDKSCNQYDENGNMTFNRMEMFKELLFDLFCDEASSALNYIDLLLHLCPSVDPFDGFLRALSVFTKKQMPTSKDVESSCQSHTKIDIRSSATVDVDELIKVVSYFNPHGRNQQNDSDHESQEGRMREAYQELTGNESSPASVPLLMVFQHPVFYDVFRSCHTFKLKDPYEFIGLQTKTIIDE